MKKIILSVCIAVMVLFSGVWGASYYVSKNGSDANPGTQSQPWLTVQKAANVADEGDTVYIKAGTYNERVVVENSGSAGKYITFTAYGNDIVTIDGSGINLPDDWGGLFDISGLNYIKVSGLRIINAGPSDNHCGILVDECDNIIIENNYTYNTTSSGIGVWGSTNITIDNNEVELACNDGEQECLTVAVTDNFQISNNHVHHGGPGSIGGEGLDGKDGATNGKIFNNHVHHMNRLGIYMDAWDKPTNNIEVYNNIIHDCVGDGITLASEMGGLLSDISIYNNIIYNNDENGIGVTVNGDSANHPMKNISIINNTIYSNGTSNYWGGGVLLDNPDIDNLVVRNNIISQNVVYSIYKESPVPMGQMTVDYNLIYGYRNYEGELKGSNAVQADPLFVSAGSDFQLQSGSPAIDAGSSTSAPSADYAGISRPQGSGVDIGAYEYKSSGGGSQALISLSPATIDVTVIAGGTSGVTRTFSVSNSGTGSLNWSASDNASWLDISPTSGSAPATVTVTITPATLTPGNYSGSVTISSADASNSPQTVTVNVTALSSANDQEPFGQFDTPLHGATVSSSVAVTGWALDDVAVESLKIYRAPVSGEGSNNVYIGDADFVEGARTDVAALYPGYPNYTRAGWGYMLLTNFLPNSGNGTFTLYAVATDGAGHPVTLGSKIITCDNANAVKPFGAIDTPTQGGTASGSGYVNWGWVLTPQPNKIPTDGSTIHVWVDGMKLGNPVYDIYRSDIAALFPSYLNSNGAVGYFYLDTSAYDNGVHTIQWTATDNGGNTDGIGSRYFTVQNPGSRIKSRSTNFQGEVTGHWHGSVRVRKGYNENQPFQQVNTDKWGDITVDIFAMQRLEIHFPGAIKTRTPLPIGASIDKNNRTLYWQPGHAFLGKHMLRFVVREPDGKWFAVRARVIIYLLNTRYPSPSLNTK